MKLYYKQYACSFSPHVVLRESGLDFSLVKVDLATKRTENGDDFLQINPKGQVPTLLLDDGTVLTEGPAIVQYLADSVPDRQLLAPVGSMTRYHTVEWLNYISTELHKGFTSLFSDATEETKQKARQLLRKKFTYVNESLQDKQWLLGLRYTVADAYLFTVLRWAEPMLVDLSGLANIEAFMARMKERPAVEAAIAAEAN